MFLQDLLKGNEIIVFALILLGSDLPDIDEPNSKINSWAGIIGKVSSFLAKHRGFFHSLLFVLLAGAVVYYFWDFAYTFALVAGLLVHLLGDSLTPRGIHWFYPFSGHQLKGPITTGSIWENGLFIVLVVVVIKFLL